MNREYYPITIIMVVCLLLDGLFAWLHQPTPSVVDHVLLVTLGILVPSDLLVPRQKADPAAATPAASDGRSS